jgi:hypothetical protein
VEDEELMGDLIRSVSLLAMTVNSIVVMIDPDSRVVDRNEVRERVNLSNLQAIGMMNKHKPRDEQGVVTN